MLVDTICYAAYGAIDAAALGVVEPFSAGIGGGGFMLNLSQSSRRFFTGNPAHLDRSTKPLWQLVAGRGSSASDRAFAAVEDDAANSPQ